MGQVVSQLASASPVEEKSLLRFTTAGSVDDGKSTLIGRLLYDSNAVYEDQMQAIEKTAERKQEEQVNLALLTDGLSAEREQGITIDVAYRYFATSKRKFIIADTPGHEQYTRNMVTGASMANLAIILIDARKGVLTQSRRHAYLSNLLGIQHVIVCVNKMDLVDYQQETFDQIVADFKEATSSLDLQDLQFIPISALEGDNVVHASKPMAWYSGPPLLTLLESITLEKDRNYERFRFPVQYVLRPHLDYRAYAGQIVSGEIKPGDAIYVLPSGKTSTVEAVDLYEGSVEQAFCPQSVAIRLTDEVDISRGDVIVKSDDPAPVVSSNFKAKLCWMHEQGLEKRKKYLLKQGASLVKAMVQEIDFKVNINNFEQESVEFLQLNDIAQVQIKTLKELVYDPYKTNRAAGNFILIDEMSNATVAAGMIE